MPTGGDSTPNDSCLIIGEVNIIGAPPAPSDLYDWGIFIQRYFMWPGLTFILTISFGVSA